MRSIPTLWLPLGVAVTCLQVAGASATVVTCDPFAAPGVVVNFCSNHGYYPRSEPLRLQHAAYGLSVVRQRLVAKHLLRPLPVLWQVPAFAGTGPVRLSLQDDCSIDPGESAEPAAALGPCYRIDTGTPSPSYAELARQLSLLSTLTQQKPERAFATPDALPLPPPAAAADLRGVTFDDHPVHSPDGRHSVRERWTDGVLSLVLFDGDGPVRFWRLVDPLAARPLWSSDGQWLAYATLHEVVAVGPFNGQTHRFQLADYIKTSTPTQEVLLRFVSGHTLRVRGDRELFSSYGLWDFDLVRATAVERFEPER